MDCKSKVYALVDINNCYVSCERIFNPSLNNKPVIVLSNNDGCAVAHSQEQEIYSIDECFLDLTAHFGNYDLTDYAQQIRQRVFS